MRSASLPSEAGLFMASAWLALLHDDEGQSCVPLYGFEIPFWLCTSSSCQMQAAAPGFLLAATPWIWHTLEHGIAGGHAAHPGSLVLAHWHRNSTLMM